MNQYPSVAGQESSSLLQVENVTKSYSINIRGQIQKKTLLDSVSFSIGFGQLACILGPSGSGKTTFLEILSGLTQPESGEILFQGQNIFKNEQSKRMYLENMTYIFQDYKLIPHLNVIENVSLGLRLRGLDHWKEKAYEAMEKVGISYLEKMYPKQLSGGESQRVGIARAITMNPLLILADEPTGNLDLETGKMIIEIFHKMKEDLKISFIIVTHNVEMIEHADETFFLRNMKLKKKSEFMQESHQVSG